MKKTTVVAMSVLLGACATAVVQSTREGLVEYAGSQKTIFDTGKATAVMPVAIMAGDADFFGVGAVEGLDGEITVFKGKRYNSATAGITRLKWEG